MERIGKAQEGEFGVKVSGAGTNHDNCIVGMRAEPGNPYDGHTLGRAIAHVERITGQATRRMFVACGYRGHRLKAPQVVISGSRRV